MGVRPLPFSASPGVLAAWPPGPHLCRGLALARSVSLLIFLRHTQLPKCDHEWAEDMQLTSALCSRTLSFSLLC